MIICTNCNHQNPEGSVQCENCYAPLPKISPCPHCGAPVQSNATFCGQCGYNLQLEEPCSLVDSDDYDKLELLEEDAIPTDGGNSALRSPWDTDTGEELIDARQDVSFNPMLSRERELMSSDSSNFAADIPEESAVNAYEVENLEEFVAEESFYPDTNLENDSLEPDFDTDLDLALDAELPEMSDIEELEATTAGLASTIPEIPKIAELSTPEELEIATSELEFEAEIHEIAELSTSEEIEIATSEHPVSPSKSIGSLSESVTRLQLQRIILSHVQTGTEIEITHHSDIIRIGKPNSQIPPDIDVSGFPDSNIVSRVHANIRVEGDTYFIEDLGSSNGTYVNHKPLMTGNRHRLRFGDRISLGKGDLMTFIFKIIDE